MEAMPILQHLGLVLAAVGICWLFRGPIDALVASVKAGIPLPPPAPQFAEHWKLLTCDPGDRSGRILGDLERAFFVLAFWFSADEAVAAWFAFKVAAKWEAWHSVGKLPDELQGVDHLSYMVSRRRWASQRLMSFLVGSLANVLVALGVSRLLRLFGDLIGAAS
jgi:hypothetical protein